MALLFFLSEVTVKLSVSLAAAISAAELDRTVVLDISAIWFSLNVTLKALSLSLAHVKLAMAHILFFRQEICWISVRVVETAVFILACSAELAQ